ncbi:PREDICTED: MATH domain and coiled-coil domain-containing protein At3g58440-like [Camelina sativa]|uniref:MATH domain and coiled-coil domain-containing protein At3g58440-like n=1 Tax=Camelina sativa TaxID=90675 RepID=A0ABM0ZJ64_CAMSA|nr:PREDICTED: MATH domain and coiled-coil domain-containing protein At3g58440-like [Camelina sativa]
MVRSFDETKFSPCAFLDMTGGQYSFDAKDNSWGFEEFLPLDKLLDPCERYMVSDRLIILAEVQVLPAVVVPEEPVKIIEPLSSKEGNQVSDTSFSRSQGHSSCQVAEASENASKENFDDDDDASEEGMDDDDAFDEGSDEDDASEEGSEDDDDDASSPVSDDGGMDISSLSQSNASEDVSRSVGNYGISSNSVAAETEFSNCDNGDAPKEDADDDTSSFVSKDSARNRSSLDQVKSLEDASQTAENGCRGLTMASVTGTSDNMLTETRPVKETMDVNGFEVFSSQQVESVSHIFKRHPDMAIGFRPKNQQIRRAYMDALLSLIKMLCQSPEKLSEDDLSNVDDTLVDLIDAGFKLDWLKTKLDEVNQKKKMEQGSGARIQTMEEQLQKLKRLFLDLESQLQTEKVDALVARAPLSFNDVVC